jgi:hypothetical protein
MLGKLAGYDRKVHWTDALAPKIGFRTRDANGIFDDRRG